MSLLLGQLRPATSRAAAQVSPVLRLRVPHARGALIRSSGAALRRFAAGQAEAEDASDAPGGTQGQPEDPSAGSRGRKSRSVKQIVTRQQPVEEGVNKLVDEMSTRGRGVGSFNLEWRGAPGHRVAYRYRMLPTKQSDITNQADAASKQKQPQKPAVYSDYAGLRFPTLETAENYDYHKDRGLDRIVERAFPIKVPGHRRLDPYLREYIHFLHHLDPVRFTIERIAERYRLRKKTVALVVKEWGTNMYLTRSGLTRLRQKQQTKESVILAAKEQHYAKWVGWDQLGDEDDPDTDDETLGDFKGWRSTSDWIRKQSVEVEMMSAFPKSEKRDPMPKRVDVDLVVDSKQHHKVINWIDPTDKVVF